MDFMQDSLHTGSKFRALNVIDDCNRESLSIEIDYSLPAERVVRALEQVAEWRGYPNYLRIDNGPEFISQQLEDWAEQHGVTLDFNQPASPPRTRISSDATGPIVKTCWICTCAAISMRYGTSPPAGCMSTIPTGLMNRSMT